MIRSSVIHAKQLETEAEHRRDLSRVSRARTRLEAAGKKLEHQQNQVWNRITRAREERVSAPRASVPAQHGLEQMLVALRSARERVSVAQRELEQAATAATVSQSRTKVISDLGTKVNRALAARAESTKLDEAVETWSVARALGRCEPEVAGLFEERPRWLGAQPAEPTSTKEPIRFGDSVMTHPERVPVGKEHVVPNTTPNPETSKQLTLACDAPRVGQVGMVLRGGAGKPVDVVVRCESVFGLEQLTRRIGEVTSKLRSMGIEVQSASVEQGPVSASSDDVSGFKRNRGLDRDDDDERI